MRVSDAHNMYIMVQAAMVLELGMIDIDLKFPVYMDNHGVYLITASRTIELKWRVLDNGVQILW